MTDNNNKNEDKQELGLLSVAASVMAAFFGVQSKENKERDFQHGNHKTFILVGAIITALFMLTLFLIVQLVIN